MERPASVVKELLENSLDAGATDLRIDIDSGGRRLIRVADNGSGMLRDDALLAFERHATSKLSDVKDLLSIATLGFRGEALPSIASVSRLLLETRAAEETTGAAVEIAGGKMLRCDEFSRTAGTTISVRDLFYNVPARKKFLRSDQTELAHIASLVTHYSLAHPKKSFQLNHGDVATAGRHARGNAAGARLSGVRQSDAGRPDRSGLRGTRTGSSGSGRPLHARLRAARLRFRAAGAEDEPEFDLPVRERPPDSRPSAAARAFFGVSQPDAAGLLSVRAAVRGLRLRGSGRERSSVENRGSLPAWHFRARFRARFDSRTFDRLAAGVQHSAFTAAAARGRSAVFRFYAADRKSALRADARCRNWAGGRAGTSGRSAGVHAEQDRRARTAI